MSTTGNQGNLEKRLSDLKFKEKDINVGYKKGYKKCMLAFFFHSFAKSPFFVYFIETILIKFFASNILPFLKKYWPFVDIVFLRKY